MGGTQGEEPHIAYKEGDGIHLRLAWWLLILWYVWLFGILLLFSRVAVMFSTRHSYLGIYSPTLRGLLEEYCTSFFHIQAWFQASSFSYSVVSVEIWVVLEGVVVEAPQREEDSLGRFHGAQLTWHSLWFSYWRANMYFHGDKILMKMCGYTKDTEEKGKIPFTGSWQRE